MEIIQNINEKISGIVWGIPMITLLLAAGIFLTLRLRFIQFSKFGYAIKNTIGKVFSAPKAGKGEVTPFQAVTTALARTLGIGNIAGITCAITMGRLKSDISNISCP